MPSLPIKLPPGFTPLVAVGDQVTSRQPLASKNDSHTAIINIATELSLSIEKAGKAMKVKPGDAVSPGTVLAVRSGIFGGKKVVSSVAGKVIAYDHKTGEVTVQIEGASTDDEESYLSPVAGKIMMCDNGEIVIETETDGAVSEAGSGGSVKGIVYLLKHAEDTPVPLHLLTPEIIGKVVVGRKFDRDGLLKAVGMEALGLVVRAVSEEDLQYLTEKRIMVPVVQVSEDEFEKISKRAGKEIYLDGEKKSVVILHT